MKVVFDFNGLDLREVDMDVLPPYGSLVCLQVCAWCGSFSLGSLIEFEMREDQPIKIFIDEKRARIDASKLKVLRDGPVEFENVLVDGGMRFKDKKTGNKVEAYLLNRDATSFRDARFWVTVFDPADGVFDEFKDVSLHSMIRKVALNRFGGKEDKILAGLYSSTVGDPRKRTL